jgi:hypothetical protein
MYDPNERAYKCSGDFYFRLNSDEKTKSRIYFYAKSPEAAAILFCTEYNNPLPGIYDIEVEDIVTKEKWQYKVKTEKIGTIIS